MVLQSDESSRFVNFASSKASRFAALAAFALEAIVFKYAKLLLFLRAPGLSSRVTNN